MRVFFVLRLIKPTPTNYVVLVGSYSTVQYLELTVQYVYAKFRLQDLRDL